MMQILFSCVGETPKNHGETGPPNSNLQDDDLSDDDGANAPDDDFSDDDTGSNIPPEPFDPSQYGPYPVANRTLIYVDEDRWDVTLRDWRALLVEVWYPAEDKSKALPRDIIRKFLNGWDEPILSIFRLLGVTPEEIDNFDRATRSARNPRIRIDHAPYPMVLFSHGNAGLRFQDYTMCEYLASQGYVVIAPDHTGNAVFVTFPDKLVIYNFLMMPYAFIDRQKDIMFLIDKFEELNQNDPEGFFTGMLDTTKIGVIGHSYGAATAQEVVKWDKRISAAVGFAGPQVPILPQGFDTPIMTMIGLEDHTMHDYEFLIRLNYEMRPPPKLMLEFINGGHYTFTDACILVPTLFGEGDGCGSNTRFDNGEEFDYISHDLAFEIIDTYVTAFLGAYVKNQDSMVDYLKVDMHPEEVIYDRDLGD